MAGRIMTRMTTDVDSFETLLETGLISAVVSSAPSSGSGSPALPEPTWRSPPSA